LPWVITLFGDNMLYKLVVMLNGYDMTDLLDNAFDVDIPEEEENNVNDAVQCEVWYNDCEAFA